MQVKIFLFDLLFLDGKDLRKLPLIERKEKLESLIPNIHPRLRYSNHVRKDPEKFFDINCKQQLEGIVSKFADSPYISGKGEDWTQTKCSRTQEFIIGGFNEVTQEFLLGFYEREKFWFAGKVEANGKFLTIKKKLAKLSQETSAFEKVPQQKNIHWVKPEIKAEINFSNWTDEKRLRNPKLLELVT
jgi:bifunctional non-homologous end joining protein LigD